ncbi:MAG: transcriptional regulator [Thermoanaerobaculia bacterium]
MNRQARIALATALCCLLPALGPTARAAELGPERAPDPLRQARQLVAALRAELAPVDREIANAPFLAALERHEVSLDLLRAFAGEQYNILRSDERSDAAMVSRFAGEPHGSFFLDLTTGEAQARAYLLDFAHALGMTEADLEAYEPRPGAQTYPSYAAWLGFYGSQSDIAAAYLLNFPVFGANVGRMAVALRSRYGFTAQDTAFFDYFADLPPSFETDALTVIQDGLDRCAEPRAIRRSARLLQAYEKDFWYTVGEN